MDWSGGQEGNGGCTATGDKSSNSLSRPTPPSVAKKNRRATAKMQRVKSKLKTAPQTRSGEGTGRASPIAPQRAQPAYKRELRARGGGSGGARGRSEAPARRGRRERSQAASDRNHPGFIGFFVRLEHEQHFSRIFDDTILPYFAGKVNQGARSVAGRAARSDGNASLIGVPRPVGLE